jgi:cytochrome b561
MAAHRQAGLFVMVALVLRLAVRFTQGMTDFAAGISPWMHRLAAGAHAALYLTLLACRCWAGPPPARMASR